MVSQYFKTAGYSCAMQSVWNPEDNYDISGSVYVDELNGCYVTQILIRC